MIGREQPSDRIDTIPAIARNAARRFADRPALVEGARSWTFSELYRDARQAASAFIAHGVVKGDVVALWAPNRREWILAALGAQIAGAVITPLNTRLKGREAGEILRRASARILITVEGFLGFDYAAMIAQEDLPELRQIVVIDGAGAAGFGAFMASGAPTDPAVEEAETGLTAGDLSDIMFTSGTTGVAKGVMHRHGAVIANFRRWAERVDLRPGDQYLIANPFFHTLGYKAGWVAALIQGATILPMTTFDAEAMADLIEHHKVSFMPGPPAIFQSLLHSLAGQARDFSSLRVAITGAAPVPPIMVERMRTDLGMANVVNGYGMTECGAISMTCQGDSAEQIAYTVGCALPGVEIRIVDPAGVERPIGETGEILVRGDVVMLGYFRDPDATREAIDAEGWLHTGDVGALDEAGYLRITDRLKDMYISGGFNCYPAEIEKLLAAHPAIESAAVIGVADERLGEVGRAFVVLRPGAQAEPAAIRDWAREAMANYKVPRTIMVVEDYPRNALGKILRSELAAMAAS